MRIFFYQLSSSSDLMLLLARSSIFQHLL
uniref:Uncharacterized protein n=1 Tax=Arundo donax TaxID=35708 RepID=A0A0A9APQ0_ARUDO